MKALDPDEYPLLKPGHSTSTLLICMFLGFAIGFLACHSIYSGIDKREWKDEVRREFYYEEIK
jgi:hypothetical protein